METSLKNGFAQIFSCRPKDLSCPKFGGAGAPLAPSPARTPMTHTVNIHSLKHHCKHCFLNSENKTKKKRNQCHFFTKQTKLAGKLRK